MLKKIIKKIVPATFFKIDEEGERIVQQMDIRMQRIEKQYRDLVNSMNVLFKENSLMIKDAIITKNEQTNFILANQDAWLHDAICELQNDLLEKNKELHEILSENKKTTADQNERFFNELQHIQDSLNADSTGMNEISNYQSQLKRTLNEVVWAHIFDDTITNSTWLLDKSFSPGRWGMGYMELYVLYRVLNDYRPQAILELGLGQSTKMITQYADACQNITHKVVEHDQDWIDFFSHNNNISANTDIIKLEREYVSFKSADKVRTFKGFKEEFESEKFDFIMIDAPLGGDMKEYSRIDVISILPQCLKESFVIILDDTDRRPERKTADEINNILDDNKIEYRRGVYKGEKDIFIWTSMDWTFLCSL